MEDIRFQAKIIKQGKIMHKLLHALTFGLLLSSSQAVANNQQLLLLEKRMDAIAEERIHPDGPGCSIGIIQNNAFIFKKSYGLANLEHQIPLTSQSVFRMASVSKQFTAFAVLLLADDGAITLTRRYTSAFARTKKLWKKDLH